MIDNKSALPARHPGKYLELENGKKISVTNSPIFDYYLFPEENHPYSIIYDSVVESIWQDILPAMPFQIRPLRKKLLLNFVCNLIDAAFENRALRIHLNNNMFDKEFLNGIDHISSRRFIHMVKLLHSNGYIHHVPGFMDRTKNKGRTSRIFPMHKFVNLVNIYEIVNSVSYKHYTLKEYPAAGKSVLQYIKPCKRIRCQDAISVKDDDKCLILDFVKDADLLRQESFIKRYNEFMDGKDIVFAENEDLALERIESNGAKEEDLAAEDVMADVSIDQHSRLINDMSGATDVGNTQVSHTIQDSSSSSSLIISLTKNTSLTRHIKGRKLYCKVRRVYNNSSTELGGRFYGPDYQSLSEEERAHILIDGEDTVELDYSGFHIRMLYHQKGLPYIDDPYIINSLNADMRPIIKIATNILLNAQMPNRATYELQDHLYEDQSLNELWKQNGSVSPWRIIHAIMDKHAAIEECFYQSNRGLRLQKLDSDIACSILDHFTSKGIPCLCIHDSFIVSAKYEQELNDVMIEVYKQHMNGFTPIVK